jgi:PAS domain S-box-containing protein
VRTRARHAVTEMVTGICCPGESTAGVDAQQRRITLLLEIEKERLVNTQAVAKVGSWETDIATGGVVWSQETHKIFETSSETFRPSHQAFLLAVHPEDRESVEAAFRGSATQPAVNSVEHRVLLPDGRIKFVEERWQTISDVDGRHLRAIGTCRDITETKLTENALRQSNDKFLQLAENITDVFWIRSADMSEVHYVSPAFEQIWGAPAQSLYANPQKWSDYVVAEDRDRVEKAFAELTGSAPTIDVQYSIIRPDGDIRAIRSRGFQVRDADDKLIRLIGIVTDITEQERTADALKASMGEFRALTESMPQIVWITRPDGSNIYFNQQWTDYTGLTPDESRGDGWISSFHPEERQRAGEAWQQAIATTGTFSLEGRLCGADGSYRWWLTRGVPVRNDDGEVLKWFGTCTDIHDVKVAQLEITRANRALKMLSACSEAVVRAENEVQLLNDVCRIAVENGGYRMAWVGFAENDEARSITPVAHAGVEDGYLTAVGCTWNENDPLGRGPAGEVIRTGRSMVSDDFGDDSSVAPWSATAQQRGYRRAIRLPLRDADRTFGLLGLYSAEADQTGADEMRLLQEMAGNTAFGITSLRAESERCRMQSSVMEQAALLDTARDAIQVVGLDGQIIYWNKGAERIYGWTLDEMLGGVPVEARFRDVERFKAARGLLLERGEWEGEMIKRTKAGLDITVEERWTLVRDASGHPKSILTINTDVTEKKRLESQLMVSDRMASVGTLAAGVAHEINNPLAAVIANLEYIAESLGHANVNAGENAEGRGSAIGVMLAEIKEPLEDARKAAQRVRSIVRDLKIFSRSPSEEGTSEVDVKAVIESSLGLAWNEIRHRARLVKDYGDVPAVEANEGRLGQVFLNLIVNAAQAIPEGRAEHNVIRVTTRLRGDRVITSVSDSGQGIPQGIIARIFDPFFTTKPVGVGTGLGLAICQRIVTDTGGELTVETSTGNGATFHVALPVAVLRKREHVPAVKNVTLQGRRGRILVVDDEPMLVSVVTRILSREHEVVSALVAYDALALLTSGEKFDLILCDLMMPDMTGMDLHRELLTIAPDQANRMIFVTGGAFTEKARTFLTNPPKEHIEKPFDTSNLLAIVRRHLRTTSCAR